MKLRMARRFASLLSYFCLTGVLAAWVFSDGPRLPKHRFSALTGSEEQRNHGNSPVVCACS